MPPMAWIGAAPVWAPEETTSVPPWKTGRTVEVARPKQCFTALRLQPKHSASGRGGRREQTIGQLQRLGGQVGDVLSACLAGCRS